MNLNNTTDLDFAALDDEFREYDYVKDGRKFTIRVNNPRYLNVNTSHGAHRILDADGVVHYLPGGFLALRWKVRDGTPHFHTTVAQKDGSLRQTTFVGGTQQDR